jgi:hypothetical protein
LILVGPQVLDNQVLGQLLHTHNPEELNRVKGTVLDPTYGSGGVFVRGKK